jgi:hypothetical protein
MNNRTPCERLVSGLAAVLLPCLLASSLAAQGTGPVVQVSPGDLSFGLQSVGAVSTSQIETVTVQGGSAAGVKFSNIALTGPNAADFTLQSETCTAASFAGTCQITLVFQPSSAGVRSATVNLNDNIPGSPQTFALQGTGGELKLTSVVVGPPSPSVVSLSQVQLTAQGNYNDGTQNDITNTAIWTSSDKKVATVQQGLVTGVRSGKAVIRAALQGIAGSTILGVQYQLVFIRQPSNTPVGKEISPGVTVLVRDNGRPVEYWPVLISIGPNPPNPAELRGDRPWTTGELGTVNFGHLKLDYFGNGYTLVATTFSPGGPSSALSASFNETRVGDPCLGPNPACSSGCPDADGDGLNDAWEIAGGIDMNGDGRIDDRSDLMLPGADPRKPDIYVWYDWMDYSTPGNTCTQNSDCPRLGGGHIGETCIGPGATCAMACTADSDCTSRIPQGAHVAERCISNTCQHSHDPLALEATALQPVVDRFTAHGISLHVLRGRAQPHSFVISYRPLSQVDNFCEGGSLASGTAGLGKYAESLYDIKLHSSPDKFNIAYHYTLFSHHSGCDTPEHCTPPFSGGTSDCPYARNPDGTPKNIPAQGQSGLAEIAGNDLVVSLGGVVNDEAFVPHFVQQAAFMHELGHNLGLRHDGHMDNQCKNIADCRPGDTCADLADGQGLVCHEITGGYAGVEQPNYKPNYLSIMNYRYEAEGIPIAGAVGSPTRIPCTEDSQCGADGGMCSGSYCVRLDYSRQLLPTAGNTPGALVENNLSEMEGLSSGTADMFSFKNGTCTPQLLLAPTTGPVDWNGDGYSTATSATADVDANVGIGVCSANPADMLSGFIDWPDLSGIPFQYNFQCRSTGGPLGDGVSVAQPKVPPIQRGSSLNAPAPAPAKRAER